MKLHGLRTVQPSIHTEHNWIAFVSLASPHQVEAEDKGETEEEAVRNLAKRIGITTP